MKANKAEQQALVAILTRIYEEIRGLEEEWDFRVGGSDFRPRIEYFHDAVRALTSGGESRKGGRLSVEFLAYDIEMLRHIQQNPMKRTKAAKPTGSTSTSLVTRQESANTSGKDTNVKAQLTDLYKSYAVLFAALLADTADRNYQTRTDACNTEVEDTATLEQALKVAQKKDAEIDIAALAEQHIDDPDILNKVLFHIHNLKQKKRMLASEALRKLKEMLDSGDKELKAVEKAHFTFVTSQLAVYEMARDVVKKMAMQGMNIVGNFVESAVQEARRGGRGF